MTVRTSVRFGGKGIGLSASWAFRNLYPVYDIVLGFVIALMAGGVAAQAVDDSDVFAMRFPYQASGTAVDQVLSDVTRQAGIIIRLGDGVNGSVTIDNGDGTLIEVLEEAASQVSAVWWYDGTILHIDSDATLTTTFIDPQGLAVATIEGELRALGLYDPRFGLRSSSSGAILRVSGPQSYVDQVVALIATLNSARRLGLAITEDDVSGLYLPRVYRGRLAG